MDKLKLRRCGLLVLLVVSFATFFSFLYPIIPQVQGVTTTVGTTTRTDALSHAYGRKMFYAANVKTYWIFYANGTHLIFQTQQRGSSTWSSITAVRSITAGTFFYVWYELRGSVDYVHYIYNDETDGSTIYYRRGTLNSDETITWATSENAAYTFGGSVNGYPCGVSVDTEGYPFILFGETYDVNTKVVVSKSSLNNGTWLTDSGFPFNVTSSTSSVTRSGQIIPLTATKMYAIWAGQNILIQGRLWNGSAWQSLENASTSNASLFHRWSVTSDSTLDDTVSLVFTEYSTGDIKYTTRTTSWGTEIELADLASETNVVITRASSVLQVWWYISNVIYTKRYENGVWQATESFFQGVAYVDSISAFSVPFGGGLGLAWLDASAGSPYTVTVSFVYSYVFNGVYSEETGLLQSVSERAANITAYFTNQASETFLLNGTYIYYPDSQPQYFLFDLSNDREYWLGPTETIATIYIFDASTTVYTISFLDLAGALESYPFVTAKRYVNGTLRTVEKRKVDIDQKISMSLVMWTKYDVTISDGATYTFGDLLMTSATGFRITLKGIEFPENIILAYKYVRMYADRHNNLTSISMVYQDTQSLTTHVNNTVYYVNNTIAYTNLQVGVQSFNVTWTSAFYNTSYYVVMTSTHTTFGTLIYKTTMGRSYSANPWSLGWLGSMPMDIATNQLIPFFIVLCVFGVFSQRSAFVGMFLGVSVTALLVWIGWFSVPWAMLVTALTFTIMYALARKRRTVIGG